MSSKERVGNRIRNVRAQQNKTLRDVESASGFSSTHISEIERGRTCPTIGALIQIAHALEKDPSYFIEDRELEELSVTSRENRPAPEPAALHLQGNGILLESLTGGILGGRLRAFELTLDAGGEGRVSDFTEPTDACLYVLGGRVEIKLGDRVMQCPTGGSLHALFDQGFELSNPGREDARVLLIVDPGAVIP